MLVWWAGIKNYITNKLTGKVLDEIQLRLAVSKFHNQKNKYFDEPTILIWFVIPHNVL